MRWAILQFPGSNCDQDCLHVLKNVLGQDAYYLWHKETDLKGAEAVIVPGGFSYGDYLRCGAIAQFSPIMGAVKKAAADGLPVIGICNGFQVLCESGLLPGALLRNRGLHFICETVNLRVETPASLFTRGCTTGQVLRVPIAHGEGCYFADPQTLGDLERHGQVLFRYADDLGRVTPGANPNGSANNIAGIRNRAGNVLGLMPHPERASEEALGSTDGKAIFEAVIEWFQPGALAAMAKAAKAAQTTAVPVPA
ncbi:MAG: phosphoribosylformylglycinamidine synthase subunit PurQ [Candidatus Methylacidiphilales bacterium]|nr:phosphoribosylformylglycinamidine synthase subunit PurQ [Candidatus Methylacidiphilales bacterium]